MLVPFSLLHAKMKMDVNAQRGAPPRNPPPHFPPNISLSGHRTPIFPFNAIELMGQSYVGRFLELRVKLGAAAAGMCPELARCAAIN
jgi:hypothetical protein